MSRFVWAAWGLLVVVLDPPFLGWDIFPDVVGYIWIIIGLAGANHMSFIRVRAAAAAGIPVAVVTGTPLLANQTGIVLGARVMEVVITAMVLHQLASGVQEAAPEGDQDARRWAHGIRLGALVGGAIGLLGLVISLPMYLFSYLVLTVVGIITVVLLHRVNRAGWLDLAEPDPV